MKKIKIGVIGLGYVGLPVSVAFSKKFEVIGYDINQDRVDLLNNFIDNTLEISSKKLEQALNNNLTITSKISDLKSCNIYIVTVPTPINNDKTPDLTALLSATRLVGDILSKGDIVVYESTVYPGCTEEECVPILENSSQLKYNKDFYCGYSPERINPGDKHHTIEKIVKVTSGSTDEVANKIDKMYSSIIEAGTYKASSIKVAEAAKVIENSQRDINIAFVNELAKIFSIMGIDTNDVLDAAQTKWNFLNFRPGLVGGHCIGVDPYYLANKAQKLGYNPEIILAGRKVNDDMGIFVANEVVSLLKKEQQSFKDSKVLIMGVTFKENCPDYRNTRVINIINRFQESGLEPDVFDPWIEDDSFEKEYKVSVSKEMPNNKYDAIILAVGHDSFKEIDLRKHKKNSNCIIYDIKGFLHKNLTTNRL
ncbi:MAG: nucleotide sugar dehydrogenase [Bacteroidota bacterium]|nr:nucleotide sugar dehydrogenase [Bacteroidota bacterium]